MDINKGLLAAVVVLALFVLLLLLILYLAYRKYKERGEQINYLSAELIVNEKRNGIACGKLEDEKARLVRQLELSRDDVIKLSASLEQSELSKAGLKKHFEKNLAKQLLISKERLTLENSEEVKRLSRGIKFIVDDSQIKHDVPITQLEYMCAMVIDCVSRSCKNILGDDTVLAANTVKELENCVQCYKQQLYRLCDSLSPEEDFVSASEELPGTDVRDSVVECNNNVRKKIA